MAVLLNQLRAFLATLDKMATIHAGVVIYLPACNAPGITVTICRLQPDKPL
jgi:hypothetical protein